MREGYGGGIMVMPLRKNVPLPKEPGWKLEICMECGQECWDSRLLQGIQWRGKCARNAPWNCHREEA